MMIWEEAERMLKKLKGKHEDVTAALAEATGKYTPLNDEAVA
jgi:hypothetical protein